LGVDLPAWGIAVIALYSLLQIPAVLILARYCEVDPSDLPTPPMRGHWRGNEGSGGPPDARAASTPSPEPAPTIRTDGVRCGNCGTTNDPAFRLCRRCVEPL